MKKTLWYRSPARHWEEALPIGNGRLGAMVYGHTKVERIQLNEDSLWYGKAMDRDNPRLKEALPLAKADPALRAYVDGVKQTSAQNRTVVLSALLNDKFCIGGGSAYGSNQATTFDGTMSEIVVTPQVLTTNSFKLSRNPSPDSGVIAYWDFSGGNDSWADKSGNGHTLTAANVGKKKGAARLNSVSASLGATLDLSGYRSVTVECFAKSDASGALFTSGDGSAAGSFGAFKSVGGASAEFVPYADALNSESAEADGEWHHYALVIDGDASGAEQARFYVDGVRAASRALASGVVTLLNGTFRIGGGYDGAAFTGLIDDVRITSGALAPEEFMQPEARTEVLMGLIIKFM